MLQFPVYKLYTSDGFSYKIKFNSNREWHNFKVSFFSNLFTYVNSNLISKIKEILNLKMYKHNVSISPIEHEGDTFSLFSKSKIQLMNSEHVLTLFFVGPVSSTCKMNKGKNSCVTSDTRTVLCYFIKKYKKKPQNFTPFDLKSRKRKKNIFVFWKFNLLFKHVRCFQYDEISNVFMVYFFQFKNILSIRSFEI